MELEEDVKYIHNNFPSKPKDQSTLNELQKRVLNIFINGFLFLFLNIKHITDFKHFISRVKADETFALASVSKEDVQDFGCYDGKFVFSFH